jgi:hypothetical protein
VYQLIQADFAETLALAEGCDLVCTSPPYMDACTYKGSSVYRLVEAAKNSGKS